MKALSAIVGTIVAGVLVLDHWETVRRLLPGWLTQTGATNTDVKDQVSNGFAGRGDTLPGTTSSLEFRELPHDAERIAHKYASHLKLCDLAEPLAQFLARAERVNGLDGIGVALWEMPNAAPLLGVYVLSDLSTIDLPDAPSADTATAELYADLRRRVSAFPGRPLRLNLWSMNSAGGSFDELIAVYPNSMRDLVLDAHAPGELALPADLTIFRRGALARAA